MDQILSYGDSDSDSNSSHNSCPLEEMPNEFPTKHEGKNHGPDLLNSNNRLCEAEVSINLRATKKDVSLYKESCDYLGLQSQAFQAESVTSSYSRSNNQNESAKMAYKVSNPHKSSAGEIEIPEGDFWANFKPVENTSHNNYYSWQLGVTNGLETSASRKRKLSNISSDHPFSGQPAIKQPNNTIGGDVSQLNHRPPWSKHEQSLGKRKVYYIHSKVSPYLTNTTKSRCAKALSHSWPAQDSNINRINWNIPNFSHLLLTAGKIGMQGDVSVWNVWSTVDYFVASLSAHKKAVKHAEWLQSGREILSCSYDRTALITEVESEKVLLHCEHTGFVTSGCCHPSNGNLFFTGTEDMILMWDKRISDVPVKHFIHKEAFGQVQDLLVIQEGRELISCSDLVSRDSADRNIMAWDVASGVVLSNQIFQERYSCTRLKGHPDNRHFLAQTHGGYVAIFSNSKPYKLDKSKRFEGHKMLGYNIGFDVSPDGRLIYSGSAEGGLHCYDYTTGRLHSKLGSEKQVITDVACHPVLPSVVASCSWGGSLSIWQ